jgi:hypothetical protein
MGRKRIWNSESERVQAYQQRKKQETEQQHQTEVSKYKSRLEEIEYIERKWSEMRGHPDLGPEFLRMDLNFIREGYGYEQIFKWKKRKVLEALERGDLKP